MSLIQASDISISFGERVILNEVNLQLDKKSRIALTGGNGSGKSTFLKILAGHIVPDYGKVAKTKGVRVAYLPQSGAQIKASTLMEEAEHAYDLLCPLLQEKEKIEYRLSQNEIIPEDILTRLIERRHELEEKILESGYYDRRRNIEKVCTGLGFKQEDLEKDPSTFSGGWRMRIALAVILLEQPDVLLLDEPTNYLDIEAREWLEAFISDYPGGIVLVSHDRYFLDITMNRVAELFLGSLSVYNGNYTTYETRRKAELEELTEAFYRQQKEIQKIEDFIERFRYNASKASLVQSRIRYLDKLKPIEIPETLKKIHFTFPKAPKSGKEVLTLRNLSKQYGNKQVIKNLNLDLARGDRLALTGMNGAGKSTLMRIIAGADTRYEGSLEYGAGVKPGYFSQDSADELSGTVSVLEEIEQISRHQTDQEIRNLLGAFLFRGDDIYKGIDVLSGGEKARLALMKLLLSPVNLLLLDEPTSHLDMTAKEVLLTALLAFEGTIIFVGHDRNFIEALASRILDLGGNEPVFYHGGYDYYLYRKQREELTEEMEKPVVMQEPQEGKKEREKEKGLKRHVRKLRRREEELMEQLSLLEEDRVRLEEELAKPENYTNGNHVKNLKDSIASNDRQRESLHRQWEDIDRELSELEEEGLSF